MLNLRMNGKVCMQKVNFVEFRKHLSNYVGQARFANKWVAVTHHGKVVGGFVSPEALEFLEEYEMKKDIEAFDRGIENANKSGTTSLEDFKREIGL